MTPPDLTTLRSRIASAAGPDRELDAAIAHACCYWVYTEEGAVWIRWQPTSVSEVLPPWTDSLDATVAFAERMLPGESWTLWTTSGRWHAHFFEIKTSANAETAPLALLGAVFDRLISKQRAGR